MRRSDIRRVHMQQSFRLAPARIGARLGLIVLVVVGLIGVAVPAQAGVVSLTAFTVDSQAGDVIGGGQSFTFTSSNATITATGDDTALTMTTDEGTDHFSADLAAPTGGTLTVGTTYTTTKSGDVTNAGLDVSGDGHSCTTSTGTMTVHEITLTAGAIATLAVTYEQHCDGATPALFGELRFNSTVDYKAASASPSSIDFGTRPRTPSAPKPITVTNTGSTTLTLGTASIKGTAHADYKIDSDTCSGTTPAPNGACTIAIVFDPSSGAPRPARVELQADTARGAVVILLTGKGEKHKTSVGLKLSDERVNFNGSVTVTAHLEDYRKTHNRSLEIFAKPYGGSTKRIKSGRVDRHGNLQAKISLQKRTDFFAKFGGDVDWKSATSK